MLELDRIGAKSVNLKASIEGSKARPSAISSSVCAPEIGQVNGQTLAAAFGSMDAIMAASIEDIAVDGRSGDRRGGSPGSKPIRLVI